MMLAAPSQVTGADEMTRHEGASVNCSSPDVIVSSEYVPLALAVNVPVTWRDPVTGAIGQLAPATVRSSAPATLRQEDVTVQVPTTSPAQGVTLGQDAPPAPPPPPGPVAPAPPAPGDPPVPELHPSPNTPSAIANASAAVRIFMEDDWRHSDRIVNKSARSADGPRRCAGERRGVRDRRFRKQH